MAAFLDGQNLNFAVPASYLRRLIQKKSAAATFPYVPRLNQGRSETWRLATSGKDAVTVRAFHWAEDNKVWMSDAKFTISILNRLRQPIRNVRVSVIFRDSENMPLEVVEIDCREPIEPGLARRVRGWVDVSIWELTLGWGSEPLTYQFRVLGFEVSE